MPLTTSQIKANENYFKNILKMVKDGRFYIWADFMEICEVKCVNGEKKFYLTHKQFKLFEKHVTKKWLKKNSIIKQVE